MNRFTKRPNSDTYNSIEKRPIDGNLNVEIWESVNNGSREWVLTLRDSEGRLKDHTAMHDSFVAKLIQEKA